MTTAVFLSGAGLGASLIIAIGAQNAFVLRQGLKQRQVGWVVFI
jgi:L-lysine exporter family protein LysE/ArgO